MRAQVPRPVVIALAAARLLPVAHQVRNFADALITSVFATHDGNDLVQQIYLDWLFFVRFIYLDQRCSEPMHAASCPASFSNQLLTHAMLTAKPAFRLVD